MCIFSIIAMHGLPDYFWRVECNTEMNAQEEYKIFNGVYF
jgi:hypothetical protein